MKHNLRGLTIAELDFLRRLVGRVDEHQVRVRARLLDGQGDVLSGLGQRAVIGARVEEVGRVVRLASQGVDDHEALGGRRRVAEDLSGLSAIQALQLLEVADDDVAGQTVVDGTDVGHRHVDQADGRVGSRGLVAGGEVTVLVATQRGGGSASRVLAGLVGDERGVHGLRVVTDVADVAEDVGELVERARRRAIVVDDRGAVVAVVLHAEQAEPLLAGRQAQGGDDRLFGGRHVRIPVVVQVLAVQDRGGAVTGDALQAVFALLLPGVGVQQVHDDPARSRAAVGAPVVLVPAEQVGLGVFDVVAQVRVAVPGGVIPGVGVNDGAGDVLLGPGEPVLEALRFDAVEAALIAVLDVDERGGVGLHVFVHEVVGITRVAHAVLTGGGLGEGPRRTLAQGLHHGGVEHGQVVEHGEGATGQVTLVGVKTTAAVALGGNPRGHHDAVLQREGLGAVHAPLALSGVKAGVALVHGVVDRRSHRGLTGGQAPHLDVVEGDGGGDIARSLGLGLVVHPDADVLGEVVGVEVPVPQAARVARERAVGDDGLPRPAVGLLNRDGDGVTAVPGRRASGQGRSAPSVHAVHVAGLAQVQLDAGDAARPLVRADERIGGPRRCGVEVGEGRVVGLGAAVSCGGHGDHDVAAEVGVHLGDVDDVGGFLAVLGHGRGDDVQAGGQVEVGHASVRVGGRAVDGDGGAVDRADAGRDGGGVVVAGGRVGVSAGGEVDGLAGLTVGQLVDDEVNDEVGRAGSLIGCLGVGHNGTGRGVVATVVVAAIGGDGVALGVAGQELDIGQCHVLLAGSEGAQARQGEDALRGRREGDVLFLVAELQVAAMRNLGSTIPGARGDLGLPVGEGGFGGRVSGVLIEGEDAVFARELVVSERGVVGGARGQAEAADLGAGGGILDGEGVRIFVEAALPLGGPEGLGRVGAGRVVVDEGGDGAVGGTFADLLFGGRPQDGRVIRGVGGGERRGRCEAKHGGRKNRG